MPDDEVMLTSAMESGPAARDSDDDDDGENEIDPGNDDDDDVTGSSLTALLVGATMAAVAGISTGTSSPSEDSTIS